MKKWLVMLMIAAAIPAYASNDEAGRSGADFLKIGVGARPAAMGSAYCGLADGVDAIAWNPAGLGKAETKEAAFMHNSWLSGVNYEYLAGVLPIYEHQGLGASFSFLDPGKIERTTISNHKGDGSKFGGHNYALTLSYGKRLSKALSCGLSLKYIREEIDKFSASGFGADLAGLYETPIENLTLGAMLSNLGTKIEFVKKEDRLPLNLKLGVGYRTKRLSLALDLNKPIDDDLSVRIGGEWRMIDPLCLRFGYGSGADEGSGISAGLGFRFKDIQLDYAYVPYGDLGDAHRIGLSFRFSGREPVAKEEVILEEKRVEEKPALIAEEKLREMVSIPAEPRPLMPGNLKKMTVRIHEDQEYVRLYAKVKNIGHDPISVSSLKFLLLTKDGNSHRVATQTFLEKGSFSDMSLSPNRETGGFILFETKSPPKRLIYEDYLGNSMSLDF